MGNNTNNQALVGQEVELFTTDNTGKIAHRADNILNDPALYKNPYVKQECAANMIEVVTAPNIKVPDSMAHLLELLESILETSQKKELMLLPLGCYPGKFEPSMRKKKRYLVQQSIFGREKFNIAGRCAGFHTHYSLPHGIFDEQLRMLKLIIQSRTDDIMVNSYNLAIAIDPCLTTIMQSSPYYQGVHIGKDSRMIMYRGGPDLRSPNGMYANLQELGGLPHYKLSTLDIIETIRERFDKWNALLVSIGINLRLLTMYQSILSLNWSPVKVNPHGTLEQRGMDMNHIEYIAGTSVLLKFLFKRLREEHYIVEASKIGIREPFKLERNTIHIPPFDHVQGVLQPASAFDGMESPLIRAYCRNLLSLAEIFVPKDRRVFLRPLWKMVHKRETVSDQILKMVRKRGYLSSERLPSRIAAEISLRHAQRFRTSVTGMKDFIERRF